MVDPIGELARFIHSKPIAPLGDLLWFRVALILMIVVFGIMSVLLIGALEKRSEGHRRHSAAPLPVRLRHPPT